MKLKIEKTGTEVSDGAGETILYSFVASAETFDAFFSKLYSDKARAIIRELSCNAWDAHVAAGRADKPFEVHIPTVHEPWFEIKDNGTGLSHEEMGSLFAAFFGSNKRDRDDQIGALGLGSKSPFAYKGNGGSYSIISRIGGVTRAYAANLTAGMPGLTPFATVDTPGAPDGIEIKFAVKTSDVWEWTNKARIALEMFDPQPATNLTPPMPPCPLRSETFYTLRSRTGSWGLRRTASTPQGAGARAIMGNVQYQIGYIDTSKLDTAHRRISELPLDIYFPLGALDFAISRETLEMEDRTIEAILKSYDRVYVEMVESVRGKVGECATPWEARMMLYDLIYTGSGDLKTSVGWIISEALNAGKLYGKYANFEFTDKVSRIVETDYDKTAVTVFSHNSRASGRSRKAPLFQMDPAKRALVLAGMADGKHPRGMAGHAVEVTPDILFVVNDTKVAGDKYVHHLLQQAEDNKTLARPVRKVYVVHRVKNAHTAEMLGEAGRLIAQAGGPKATLMSELRARYSYIDAPSQARAKLPAERRDIVQLRGEVGHRRRWSSGTGWAKAWERSDSQPQGTKYYVVLDHLVPQGAAWGADDAWSFHRTVCHIRRSGKFGLADNTPVYGLRKGSKLVGDPEWTELAPHVLGKVAALMTPAREAQLSLHLEPFSDSYGRFLQDVAADGALLPCDSPVKKFADDLAAARTYQEPNWGAFQQVLSFASRLGWSAGKAINFNRRWAGVKAQYPLLLAGQNFCWGGDSTKALAEYVRLADAARRAKYAATAANSTMSPSASAAN